MADNWFYKIKKTGNEYPTLAIKEALLLTCFKVVKDEYIVWRQRVEIHNHKYSHKKHIRKT